MSAADLPDSPDQAPGSQTNADDLLSQLAGNEIDRLLAEADVAAAPAGPASKGSVSAGVGSEKIEETVEPMEAAAAKASMEAGAAAVEEELPSEEASVTAQLDDLFNELQKGPEEEVAAEVAAPLASAAEPTAKAAAADVAETDAAATVGTERDALLAAAGFETTETGAGVVVKAQAPAAPVTSAEADERSAILSAAGFEPGDTTAMAASTRKVSEPAVVAQGPAPWYVKLLERINAPVAGLPGVRRLMGLAGVVTLINALALMGYVLFIRKHGP